MFWVRSVVQLLVYFFTFWGNCGWGLLWCLCLSSSDTDPFRRRRLIHINFAMEVGWVVSHWLLLVIFC